LGTTPRSFRSTEKYIQTEYVEHRGGGKRSSRKIPLSGATIHAASGGVVAWQNPEKGSIIITGVFLHVTTVSTGACTLDIGTTTVGATTTSDNLIDGVDVNSAAGVFTNGSDAGSNGKSRQLLAEGKWVTLDEKTGDATGLVAELTIEYLIP
jgi:hypothetical protein